MDVMRSSESVNIAFSILIELFVSLVNSHDREWIPSSMNDKVTIIYEFFINDIVVFA